MKSVTYSRYGAPDVLRFVEIEKPAPADSEVLIRVRAVAVTSEEGIFRRGDDILARLGVTGLFKPKKPTLGICLSGEVEAVGPGVTRFTPGDEVWGESATGGACAEYVCLPEDGTLAIKPPSLTHEEAAGTSGGGLTALPFLRDSGGIEDGDDVLVHGASGSVGVSAVQLAEHFGANVVGVCSGRNAELVESLGADRVIDYTKDDFRRDAQRCDIIFDTLGKTSFSACRRLLKPDGVYLRTKPTIGLVLSILRTSLVGNKKAKIEFTGMRPPAERTKDLDYLSGLIETGELAPVIDRAYSFEDVIEAHRFVDSGRKRGNVVLTVTEEDA